MRKLYLQNWAGTYLKEELCRPFRKREGGARHVIFQFVDHFELAGKEPRLSQWMSRYPDLAGRHRDADGESPKHTWFYALDLMREEELDSLRELVTAGLGEVELHWHHGHDTQETFLAKLCSGLAVFQKFGFMRPIAPGTEGCFAFIHGNWSLNNSRGDSLCGIDNEIELLKSAGCYGDFTFPALHCEAQPNLINSIYYADFKRGKPGYFSGRRAEVGIRETEKEFMIFPGPLTVNWRDWRFKWHPTIENGEIGASRTHCDSRRIDAWIQAGIHVKGRPEWIFVKVFCHGGQDHSHVLDQETDRMLGYLEERYNDGSEYLLHYVTSREAYNIVKAAEDGKTGDPHQYRDYLIPHPFKR